MASVSLRISGVTPAKEIRRLAASNCGSAPVQSVRARAIVPGGKSWLGRLKRARFRGPRCRPELGRRSQSARAIVNVGALRHAGLQDADPVPVPLDPEEAGLGGRRFRQS